MTMSAQIKQISYLKAHAAEIVRNMGKRQGHLVITQNGEAKCAAGYPQLRAGTGDDALLKILALGNRQIAEGTFESAADAIKRLRTLRENG